MQVQSALFFESPEEIFARVFGDLKPRTAHPRFEVRFCRFANANSFIKLENGSIEVKISDLLSAAPAPVLEALAYILLSKLYRKPVPRGYMHRYKLYLNRRDVRKDLHQAKQERGRKIVAPASGDAYNLEEIFEDLNLRFFNGLMSRPALGWSKRPSRTLLGHYDPAHHMIVLSRILDRTEVPRLAVEYVMFHEMLHLRHPVEHRGARRCVHTPAFKAAEKQFPQLKEARLLLRRL